MARVQKKNDRPRRKVVIIIVDGQSDENALSVALAEFFEEKYGQETIVLFAQRINDDGTKGGDITSLYGVNPETIEKVLNYTTIMPCIRSNNLMPKYVSEIVHIIDSDGAFIPDSAVIYQESPDGQRHHMYTETCILTNDVAGIIKRNHLKQENIRALLKYQKSGFPIRNYHDTGRKKAPTTKAIVVPYTIFYFSCNLDHFINNNPNLDYSLKVQFADVFGRKYGNSLESFKRYILQHNGRVDMEYEESWDYIQQDFNSLRQITNINLLF